MRNSRCAWRRHRSTLVVAVILLSISGATPNEVHIMASDDPQAPKTEELMKVITGPDGVKTLEARWAIGSRTNVEHLYIPLDFVNPFSFLSCKSRISQSDEGCKAGYTVDLILDVDLSVFTSIPHADAGRSPGSTAEFFMQSILQGTKNLNVRQWRNIDIEVARNMLTIGIHDAQVVNKESVFGLKVLGLEHGPKSDATPTYKEILYDGETPTQSDHVIVCPESGLAGDDPEFLRHHTPHCEQYIDLESISAVSKIRYDREYLKYWREIDSGARTLLQSFTREGR